MSATLQSQFFCFCCYYCCFCGCCRCCCNEVIGGVDEQRHTVDGHLRNAKVTFSLFVVVVVIVIVVVLVIDVVIIVVVVFIIVLITKVK